MNKYFMAISTMYKLIVVKIKMNEITMAKIKMVQTIRWKLTMAKLEMVELTMNK